MDFKAKVYHWIDRVKIICNKVKEKVLVIYDRCKPALKVMGKVFGDIGYVLKLVCRWAYKLKGLFLSIPVVIAAILFALKNMQSLPAEVGLLLQTSGEYAYMVSRETAVYVPLIITVLCVVFTLCSRRVVYPWLISIFSLALPVLLMVTSLLAG